MTDTKIDMADAITKPIIPIYIGISYFSNNIFINFAMNIIPNNTPKPNIARIKILWVRLFNFVNSLIEFIIGS